jgi:hypothetical protein
MNREQPLTGTRRKTNDAPPEDLDTSPEALLNSSPFEGDLAEELAVEPRPRRRPPSITVLLGAAVLIVGGFIAGAQADRHWGTQKSSGPSALFPQAAGRGGQGGGGGGGFGAGGFGQNGAQNRGGAAGGGAQGRGSASGAGGGTSGTVKLVDGTTIYVQTANGIVRVKTTGSTKVTVAKKSTAKALKAGSPVVVQGTPGQDGTVTATSVQGG